MGSTREYLRWTKKKKKRGLWYNMFDLGFGAMVFYFLGRGFVYTNVERALL